MNKTEKRKEEHVNIVLNEDVSAHHNYWDDVRLIHNALPEINKDEIDLSTKLLGKRMNAPVIIAGMTGGYSGAKKINENLAKTAEFFQIGMGVGSQRSALENNKLRDTYGLVKNYDIPLRIANIGASQIVRWKHKECIDNVLKIIEMIDADAVAICLNFLQEIIQPEGEAEAKGCYDRIKYLAEEIDIPVVVKESGAGITYDVAERLMGTSIAALDVGGLGGTSFAAIEHYRAKAAGDEVNERCGKTFWDWGIPTPQSLIEVVEVAKGKKEVIATGGIRNGLDVAKAIALGADAAGVAQAMLKPAIVGEKAVVMEMDTIFKELEAAMFLVGASNIKELHEAGVELWI
ncbi:MAG TPA: type 2 isopentenyl-diphosphate Delta-isomerase [Thermoplasmatales archaeon]|nr:type 2 isopentenyl-diphosphate Delta-isomerase [Thermoplasmatales archaeon]